MNQRLFLVASYVPSILSFRGPLICALQKKGYSVFVLAPFNHCDFQYQLQLEDLGVTCLHLPINRRRAFSLFCDLQCFAYLVAHFFRLKPRIVFSYTFKPVAFTGFLFLCLKIIPCFKSQYYPWITGLGRIYTKPTKSFNQILLRCISNAIYRTALASANTVFFQNNSDYRYFKYKKIIAPEKRFFRTFGSGVDLDFYCQSDPLYRAKPIFLFIARLIRPKGIIQFLDAAKICKESNLSADFHVAGGFEDTPDGLLIRRSILDSVNQGIVKYLGDSKDVVDLISESSFVVLPTYYREGLPRILLEALSVGRPIIVGNKGPCMDLVKGNSGAIVTPLFSPEPLASVFFKAAAIEKCKYLEMCYASRVFASKTANAEIVNSAIVDIIFKNMASP